MLSLALLAAAEHGINRVLRLDATALPRLAALSGRVVAIECPAPALRLFLLPDGQGLRLAQDWQTQPDCLLRAPAASLLRLALSRQKTAVLHEDEVELLGDAQVLIDLAAILQDLELDWEYELDRWLGPLASGLLGTPLRSGARWTRNSLDSLRQDLADYLSEESRALVGRTEAEARFDEIEALQLRLERLEARLHRLPRQPDTSDNA